MRGNSAMLLMCRLRVGPKSVSGIQVGPMDSCVRKLVVFQMPPLAAPIYTVFPDGSDGSTARAVVRDAVPPKFSEAGPTGVQVCWVRGLVGSWVKIRNPVLIRSATGSPRPVPVTANGRVSVNPFRVPTKVSFSFVIRRIHCPFELLPTSRANGSCGLNASLAALNGGAAAEIGLVAESSNCVPANRG